MLELLYDMCRLCLKRTGHHNLFVRQKLICAIVECAGVVIKPDVTLPQTVCNTCVGRLRVCKAFRKIVAKSDRKLRQLKTTYDLPSKESFKKISVIQRDELEEETQKNQASNEEESSTRAVESGHASTQTRFCANIVQGITELPGNKHKESAPFHSRDLEDSSDQSSTSHYTRRKIFKKKILKEMRRKKKPIFLAESMSGEYLTEFMQPILTEKCFDVALKKQSDYTFNENVDLLDTQEDIERNLSKCCMKWKKKPKSVHDFLEKNLTADIIYNDAPTGKIISDSLLADICHDDNPFNQRKKHKSIPELISRENRSVNVKDEPHCAVRNLRVDLEEIKQDIWEISEKQKSPQENHKKCAPEMLIIQNEYLAEKEVNHVETSAINPECIVSADNDRNTKSEMETSNNELPEFIEAQVMQNNNRRWKKLVNNSNSLHTEDESEYTIKTRSQRNRINDTGGVFKVKIGVSPRLKQKLVRKTLEQKSNADDSVFQICESTIPVTMTNYNDIKLVVEVKKEDHSCFLNTESINENCKENSLEDCIERNNSDNRIDKNLELPEKLIQVESVHREELELGKGVYKGKYNFINKTSTKEQRRLQRKRKRKIDYSKAKDQIESEFSQLSGDNCDYERNISREVINNKAKSENVTHCSIRSFENIKENKLKYNTADVFETTLDLLHSEDENAKRLRNSKELVCKKCKPLRTFTNRGEYKIHNYLHMRINRFC